MKIWISTSELFGIWINKYGSAFYDIWILEFDLTYELIGKPALFGTGIDVRNNPSYSLVYMPDF